MAELNRYTIGEVAALLGISPHTIRAWERRHGILRPERTSTRQRRYRGEDVDFLREIKRAIDLDGLSLRLAFQAVRGEVDPEQGRRSRPRSSRPPILATSGDSGLWRAIVDVLPQLMMIIDQNGTIIDANIAVARTLGVVRQRIAGRKFVELAEAFDRGKASLLYQPQLRNVSAWELNVATRNGPRMYSFRSWRIGAAGANYLAIVGSEMFPESPTTSPPHGLERESRIPVKELETLTLPGDVTTIRTLENLLDELPFGLAVTTIGTAPRIVYANGRISNALGLPSGGLLGRRLDELLPADSIFRALREAVDTRRSLTMRRLAVPARGGPSGSQRLLNVAVRPMFSTTRRVTSALVIVEDATDDVSARVAVAKGATERRYEEARTLDQLAELALIRAGELLPSADFIITFARPNDRRGALMHLSPGWRAAHRRLLNSQVRDLIAKATSSGKPAEMHMGGTRPPSIVKAVPLVFSNAWSAKRQLGVVAWRRSLNKALTGPQEAALDKFLAQLAMAAEVFHIRADVARKTSRFEAVIDAAAVVGEPTTGYGGLGVRFLQRLVKAVDAAGAAIGRVTGATAMAIEAVYSDGRPLIKRGDTLDLRGDFVAESIKHGQSTAASELHRIKAGLPSRKSKLLGRVKHAVSVPLMLHDRITGAIIVWRTKGPPFSDEDVSLVQALSGVALLAVFLTTDAS